MTCIQLKSALLSETYQNTRISQTKYSLSLLNSDLFIDTENRLCLFSHKIAVDNFQLLLPACFLVYLLTSKLTNRIACI